MKSKYGKAHGKDVAAAGHLRHPRGVHESREGLLGPRQGAAQGQVALFDFHALLLDAVGGEQQLQYRDERKHLADLLSLCIDRLLASHLTISSPKESLSASMSCFRGFLL